MAPRRPYRLPVHPLAAGLAAEGPRELRIDGLVERPGVIGDADLAALPRAAMTADFRCEEGWSVPDLGWAGVRLGAILDLAGPLPAAAFVSVWSGSYAVPLPLAEAAGALLADSLDGSPLSVEEGGPRRLLVPGGKCFSSVKWVDRIEVRETPGEATGERIARSRLG